MSYSASVLPLECGSQKDVFVPCPSGMEVGVHGECCLKQKTVLCVGPHHKELTVMGNMFSTQPLLTSPFEAGLHCGL